MPCSFGPRPSHSWKAAYTGTFRYAAIANFAMLRTCAASGFGTTKMRATISLSGPASRTYGATFLTSSAESQLMIAPSPTRPASRSMP